MHETSSRVATPLANRLSAIRGPRAPQGFNVVYNLTDVPSFVSGQHIVLFDPHAAYLPGVSLAQPGE
jgi:hypothetical protein